MSKNKNTKSASVSTKSVNSPSFSTRLSNSGGRFVGVTTKSGIKYNGQIRSVSPAYVTMFDRNQKKQVKFAISSITSVSGV